jgi:hypothetical protein
MRSRLLKVVAGLAVAAGVIAVGVSCVSKQVHSGNDFPIYFEAARTLLRGGSPYDVTSGLHGYVYLPFFALLLAPLTALPLAAAAWVWYLENIGFLVASIVIAIRVARSGEGARLPAWAAVVAIVPLLGFFHDNLALGQANLVLLLLVVGGIAGVLRERQSLLPGVLLGIAAALKMNLVILVVPILLRGRIRPAAGFAAGIAGALLLPLLLLGPGRAATLMTEWRAKVIAPAAAGTLQGSKMWDQSPQAALRRLLVDSPAYGETRVNVASMSQASFTRIGRIVGAAILASILLLWALGRDKTRVETLAVDFAIGCCASLQIVGFNLKAQFVLLLVPLLVAVSRTLGGARDAGAARGSALALAAALLLLSNPGFVGRSISNVALGYSSVTVATLLLLLTLAWLRFGVGGEVRVARRGTD